jgi:hypothetical protein
MGRAGSNRAGGGPYITITGLSAPSLMATESATGAVSAVPRLLEARPAAPHPLDNPTTPPKPSATSTPATILFVFIVAVKIAKIFNFVG